MNITVIGTGYVGLVTGTCFSETGNKVTCVDIDKDKVDKLTAGKITIYEPGLEKIFLRNIKEGRLRFTSQLADAVEDAEIIFLALPTPPGADGSADLKYVLGVSENLGKILKGYKVIVNKSTVPVGTADKVKEAIGKTYKGEFLRQGNPVIFMDERSSELTKYAANSFLATKISFMNEIAQLCERMGADVDMIRIGIGSDDRIGKRFLFPGIGYGGSCFPKDVQALIMSSDEVNYNFQILKAVEKVNLHQKLHLVDKIINYYNGNLLGKRFALWGLAFKPNTDDIREAPALTIIEELTKLGATINAYDPEAMPNVRIQVGHKIQYSENQYKALEGSDALIIATEWSEFRAPDFELMKSIMGDKKAIFDGRNLFEMSNVKMLGFDYFCIGKV
jgi:UDPglucose 6-dehydrogenase